MSKALSAADGISICWERSIFGIVARGQVSINERVSSLHNAVNPYENVPSKAEAAEVDRLTAWPSVFCWCGQECVVGLQSARHRPILCSGHRAEAVRAERKRSPPQELATQPG